MDDQLNWNDHLNSIQYVINNTYHSSLKTSPSKLLLGYDQRDHSDINLSKFLNNIAKTDLDHIVERESNRQLALKATNKVLTTKNITMKGIKSLPNTMSAITY